MVNVSRKGINRNPRNCHSTIYRGILMQARAVRKMTMLAELASLALSADVIGIAT